MDQRRAWLKFGATCLIRCYEYLTVTSAAVVVPGALVWAYQLRSTGRIVPARVLAALSLVAVAFRIYVGLGTGRPHAPNWMQRWNRLTTIITILLSPCHWPVVMRPSWSRRQQSLIRDESAAALMEEVHQPATGWTATLESMRQLQTRSRAAAEMLRSAMAEAEITAACEEAAKVLIDEAYFPLYVDAIVTSLPLCVAAIVVHATAPARSVGASTGWFVVGSGLTALLLRLPQLLYSCDVKLQCVRVSAVLHDWASMTYLVITLGAHVKACSGMSARATWNAAPWLIKLWLVKAAVVYSGCLGIIVKITYDGFRAAPRWRTVRRFANVGFIGFFACPGPILIIESVRLGGLICLFIGNGAQRNSAQYRLLSDFLVDAPYRTGRDYLESRPGSRVESVAAWRSRAPMPWDGMPVGIAALSTTYTVSQLISFAFPFANAALSWRQHSTLQRVAFAAVVGTLLPIAALARHTYRRFRMYQHFCYVGTDPSFTLEQVLQVIQRHLHLADLRVLMTHIDEGVLPRDVVQVVLTEYLSPEDIDVKDWSAEELEAVRVQDIEA